MDNNSLLLEQLLSQNQIAIESSAFLANSPTPLPEDWDFERVEGILLGLAIGDALGNTTESQLPLDRRQSHGEIRDYLPNHHAGNRPVGVPSDDTQMAFWTLEQLLADGGLIPDHLASIFTQQQIFGVGSAVKDFLRSYKAQGKTWIQAGQPSAGNGALMRIAPVLIPHLRQPSPALWADAAIAGMVTHNDRASIACCVAFTYILWECLHLKQTPDPIWWVDTFTSVASQLEVITSYSPRNSKLAYEGTLWQFIDKEVRQAINEKWTTLEACNRWHSGAYLLETMPCVLYILSQYGDNPEEAIIRAVNDTKDNDTVAAIVGAAVGAVHGRAAIPTRWIRALLGRTGPDDDWHIFELIEDAKQSFWQADPPLNQSDIQAVLIFLPIFEKSDFISGQWVVKEGIMPYYNYTSEVSDFMAALYQHGFIRSFNWANWEEGKRLLDDPALLQKSSFQTIRKLLTAHVRTERFSEGHLAHLFETGQIVMILKRLAEINN
ncbi:ADP-ribosylglycohydrolase family protein [Dolichospermum sp. ST_sed3]|nr:ADP-ribosylglycohydrolase family protein [Dolichospermum sp. ST_sed3]